MRYLMRDIYGIVADLLEKDMAKRGACVGIV